MRHRRKALGQAGHGQRRAVYTAQRDVWSTRCRVHSSLRLYDAVTRAFNDFLELLRPDLALVIAHAGTRIFE